MISDDSLDPQALAAEYVLGTLDPEERARAQMLLDTDTAFAGRVQYWERRLGELQAMVDAVEPPSHVWERLSARLDAQAPSSAIRLPGLAERGGFEPVDDSDVVVDLTRRLRRWRESTMFTGALAAGLAALVIASVLAPDILPERLRPKPRVVEVVKTEVVKSEPSRFVAVLQQDAASPAFILTVDIEGRSLTVRRVAADVPSEKSYELWLVSDRYPAPRSLGVVGDTEFTVDGKLGAYDPATITEATYAVTLEPVGGSPTGIATGPVLWTGKLVQALPGARPSAPRAP